MYKNASRTFKEANIDAKYDLTIRDLSTLTEVASTNGLQTALVEAFNYGYALGRKAEKTSNRYKEGKQCMNF